MVGMKLPSVSVVVPTYNRAAWLPGTVASILQQTLPPAEVLIVDDGSTDDTEQVCSRFAAPVRYLRQENSGAAAARNRGIKHAAGEWIAFIDSDDLWEPTKLRTQLAVLEATETRWSATNCVLVDQTARPVKGAQGYERAFPVFGDFGFEVEPFLARALEPYEVEVAGSSHRAFAGDAFELFFLGNFALTSTVMLHREVVAAVGGFDEAYRVAEDTEYFHRVASRFPGAFVLSPLTKWRVGHDGRITSPGNVIRLIEEAISSLHRAARLRQPLSTAEQRAYRAGLELQVRKLAYGYLSLCDGKASRSALRTGWEYGVGRTPGAAALYMASLLPATVLKGLARIKGRMQW
jgi:glycosyltransferase involved in cell wall biosynthesis